jgi:uncharacterized cupredoxin-like copper-binding protein
VAGRGVLFAAALLALPTLALAASGHHPHGPHDHSKTDGAPGKAAEVGRTVRVEARDTAFDVKQIQVRAGETVRFVIVNRGKLPHEFAIASAVEGEEHRAMMRANPEMRHDEPNRVSLRPGETRELVWKFGRSADVEFSCDIPGHAEQGMKGTFRLVR